MALNDKNLNIITRSQKKNNNKEQSISKSSEEKSISQASQSIFLSNFLVKQTQTLSIFMNNAIRIATVNIKVDLITISTNLVDITSNLTS